MFVEDAQEISSPYASQGEIPDDEGKLSNIWPLLGLGVGLSLTILWSVGLVGLLVFLLI